MTPVERNCVKYTTILKLPSAKKPRRVEVKLPLPRYKEKICSSITCLKKYSPKLLCFFKKNDFGPTRIIPVCIQWRVIRITLEMCGLESSYTDVLKRLKKK